MSPTYVFFCGKCGYRTEDYRSMSKRDDNIFCPACGTKLDRCIGTGQGGFNLKGPGFYQNDYPKEKK